MIAAINSPVKVDLRSGEIRGERISETIRMIKDLKGIFKDEQAYSAFNPLQQVYRVQGYLPVSEGHDGGLFWGNTFLEPGRVGDEYFMTKGHFHANIDKGEYYFAVSGEGALILMDENRKTWWEKMVPGSVHYIPGRAAHRVANTGDTQLRLMACWPSDAGHDYKSIAANGFGARLRCISGEPVLVEER